MVQFSAFHDQDLDHGLPVALYITVYVNSTSTKYSPHEKIRPVPKWAASGIDRVIPSDAFLHRRINGSIVGFYILETSCLAGVRFCRAIFRLNGTKLYLLYAEYRTCLHCWNWDIYYNETDDYVLISHTFVVGRCQ